MPPGDFPGYAAQVQYVRDSLLEHGRVPRWCVECYGGTTNFTSNMKEYLVFPLAVAFDPVIATKLAFVLLRWIGAFGLLLLVTRELAAPAVGIAAGLCLLLVRDGELPDRSISTSRSPRAILPLLWLSAAELCAAAARAGRWRSASRWRVSSRTTGCTPRPRRSP